MIVLSLRLIVLFLIFTSLFHLFYNKLKIDVHFIPVISFSTITIILFFAGLLNILFATILIINSVLLIYLVHILLKKRLNYQFMTFGFLFFVLLILFFALIFRGTMLTAYDDFSHWGLLAREIVSNDQLPNFETPVMNFPSYPPGSALFLYFISNIIGYSEGVLFFSQSVLLLSGILPVFALVKNNKMFNYTMIVLSAILLLTANNHIFMLSVDTLLSILSIAVLALLVYLHNNDELERAPALITPILSLLIISKNSGALFVLISIFAYILLSHKEKKNNYLIKPRSLILLFPFILSFLWGKHVELVYTNGLESKHSFSISNYRNIFGDKNPDDIRAIIRLLTERMINISRSDVQILSGILITFLIISLFKRINQNKAPAFKVELKLIFSSLILYFLYQFSLGGMYVFSMPLNEAYRLAGYGRYNYTIILYLYGVLLIHIVSLNFSGYNRFINLFKLYLIVVVSSFILAPENNNLSKFNGQNVEDTYLRSDLLEAKSNHNIPPNEDVYIYFSDSEKISDEIGYLRFVGRYDFLTNDVSIIDAISINEIINNQTDLYIIFVDQDNIYNEFLNKGNVIANHIIYIK